MQGNGAETRAAAELAGLVILARGGDRAASAALLERYRPLLAATIAGCRMRPPAGVASEADLWQEAYRQFLELLRDYRGDAPDDFGAYLKHMLGRRLANYVRAERRRQRSSETLSVRHLDLLHDELRTNSTSDLQNPRLRSACRQLSPKQRAVLYQHYWEEKAINEIAVALGLTPQNVAATRRRGEERLRSAIDVQVGKRGQTEPD